MKKILFISSSRADYGLLRNVVLETQKINRETYLLVTGSHLSESFGKTISEIKKDKIKKIIKKKILDNKFNENNISQYLERSVRETSKVIKKLKPTVLVILGDRYELLGCAMAATVFRIPITHIHGGEVTIGAYDDSIRHSISKLSHLHFPIHERYKKRLIQLGEEQWRIKKIGIPNLTNLKTFKFKSLESLSREYKFDFNRPFVIATFHPVTLELKKIKMQLNALIKTILSNKINAIITYPNSDVSYNKIIKELIKKFKDKKKYLIVKNLGEVNYFSLMKHAKLILGNSSSGIVEAASFKLPAINIGSRQDGKLKPANVIDTGYSVQEIKNGIKKANTKKFLDKVKKLKNPYASNNNNKKIAKMILSIRPDQKFLRKKFINKN